MSEQEKKKVETLAEAFKLLPEEEQKFLLGYAEGVIAMSARWPEAPQPRDRPA